MKKILFVVVLLALAMNVMSVFADGNQFEKSAVDANAMKKEQLAKREYFAAEATEDENVLFDNAHSNGDVLKQEQVSTRKLSSGSPKTVDVESAENENVLFKNAHNDGNVMKQEQLHAR